MVGFVSMAYLHMFGISFTNENCFIKFLMDVPNEIIMGEDAAITYSYLSISKSLVISRIPLYYYRQRHDSIVKSLENPKIEYYRLGLTYEFFKNKTKPCTR